MKFIIYAASMLSISSSAFASAQLTCSAEDGSQIQATIDPSNELSDIRIQIRGGELRSYQDARAALLDIRKTKTSERVQSLVVVDRDGNILVAVASGGYVDRTGTYSVIQCEVSY
jgi:hypothetical protein